MSEDTYDLVAFAVQAGGATGGHYKAYACYNGNWFEYNDDTSSFAYFHHFEAIARNGIDEDKFLPTFFVYEKVTPAVRAERERIAQAAREKAAQEKANEDLVYKMLFEEEKERAE